MKEVALLYRIRFLMFVVETLFVISIYIANLALYGNAVLPTVSCDLSTAVCGSFLMNVLRFFYYLRLRVFKNMSQLK